MTVISANDKIRIRSGDFAGERAVVVAYEGPTCIRVQLTKDESVLTVGRRDIINYSEAARRAWKTMPQRQVGRPKSVGNRRTSVTLRMDADLWSRFQALEAAGKIANRSEFFENIIKNTLDMQGE